MPKPKAKSKAKAKAKKKVKKKQAEKRSSTWTKALDEYEKGMRLFNRKDYSKAVIRFKNLIETYPQERELGDRARTYMKVCERLGEKTRNPRLSSFEDYYYHGIMAMNREEYNTALKDFEAALKTEPKNDAVTYLLGIAHFKNGNKDSGFKLLEKSISLNPLNRCYAHNDPDLEEHKKEKKFEKLLQTGKGKAK